MFKKNPKQKEAMKILTDPNIIFPMLEGGSRSGKTMLLLYLMFVRAFKYPSRHITLRKHINHVIESIWLDTVPKLISLLHPNLKNALKISESRHFIKFPNGSEYWIGGLDDKERTEKILGKEFSTIHINEASQISYDAVNTVKTRLAENSGLVNKMYFDQNPPKKNHWTYKVWHLKQDPIEKISLKNSNQYASFRMNPVDNIENIGDSYLNILKDLPEKQRKRFLDGLYGDENEGKVFKSNWTQRFDKIINFDRIVIALDPAVTNKETSDEFGMVVCAKKNDFGYVLEDRSGKYTPKEWADISISLYNKWKADAIVAEVNNGGDLVEANIRTVNKYVKVIKVNATRGKVKRAEPVAGLYESKYIYHYGHFNKLEDEMVEFDYNEDKNVSSPNRVDALVWGFTELFCLHTGNLRIRSL